MSVIATARFTVDAVPEEVAAHVREHGRDPVWGHATLTEPAAGFGPCRLCLRTFREGELRTLFTHDSCAGVAEFPQPGPVYVHADGCERYWSAPAYAELRIDGGTPHSCGGEH